MTTGYCPHCGRGDCSPTAQQWLDQRDRAIAAEAAIARVRAELDRIARLPTVATTGPADSFSTGVRWVIRQLHENALDGTT